MILAVPADAQTIAVETLTDIEAWKTDDSSRLLSRNGGRALLAGRVHAFVAARVMESLEFRALGRAESSTVTDEDADFAVEQLALRYGRSRAFTVEAGKVLYPVGIFAARRFSNVNPVIGSPDLYVPEYPLGIVLSGAAGMVDYRAAVVSLPLINPRYAPEPGKRARPVVGVGLSAGPSFHIGAAATRGAYLSERVEAQLPAGTAWNEFSQSVLAADARYSAGYVEMRAEAAWSSYDVPTIARPVNGFGWYAEARATLSPRAFVAARYEDSRYAFIRPVSPTVWVGNARRQMNGEIGVGYRITADALVKTSLRKDRWPVQTSPSGMRFPNGYAVAMQFSWRLDLAGVLEGKY